MKKLIPFVLLAASLMIGCKKDDNKSGGPQTANPTEEDSYEIRYRMLTDVPGIAVQVKYVDKEEDTVTAVLDGNISDWSNEFTNALHPFKPKMIVNFSNQTNSNEDFSLMIYLNDSLVAFQQGQVNAMTNATGTVDYIVE